MTNEHRSAPQARSLAFRLPCCFGGFVRAVVILSASPMPRLAMRAASRFFRARKPFVSALSARLFENAHVKFDLHTFVRLIVVSNAIRLSQSPKSGSRGWRCEASPTTGARLVLGTYKICTKYQAERCAQSWYQAFSCLPSKNLCF